MAYSTGFLIVLQSIFYSVCDFAATETDSLSPVLLAPDDIVISSEHGLPSWTALSDLKNGELGIIRTDSNSRGELKTLDRVCEGLCLPDSVHGYPGRMGSRLSDLACHYYDSLFQKEFPDSSYDLVWGMEGLAIGFDSLKIELRDYRSCQAGLLQRIFIGFINFEEILRDTQNIWVIDCIKFNINTSDLCDPNDDLIWDRPFCDSTQVFKMYSCKADTNSNVPGFSLKNFDPANISIGYFDEIRNGQDSACLMIKRRFEVIDWCQYQPFKNPNAGRWEFPILIEFYDTTPPLIQLEIESCLETSIPKFLDSCSIEIKGNIKSSDDCSPLAFQTISYKIDLYNDSLGIKGNYDVEFGPSSLHQYQRGDSTTNRNLYAFYPAHPTDFSGRYPIGRHRFEIKVEDGCGNTSVETKFIELKDCVGPSLKCDSAIREFIFPISGVLQLEPVHFIQYIEDRCSNFGKIKLYFDEDPEKKILEYHCKDLISSRVLVDSAELTAEDEAGNKSVCNLIIRVEDVNEICPSDPANLDSFQLKLVNAFEKPIHNSIIKSLLNSGKTSSYLQECQDSFYISYDRVFDFLQSYEIQKKDNHLNGVDVLDPYLLGRYLKFQNAEFPFTILTADVNRSNSVGALDLREMIYLIIGSVDKFSKFDDPWFFLSETDSLPKQNFKCASSCRHIGIKLGDLNHSALSSCTDSLSKPTECVPLLIEDLKFSAGDTVSLNVRAARNDTLACMQLSIKFDSSIISELEIHDGNWTGWSENQHLSNAGRLNTLWIDPSFESSFAFKGMHFFTLSFIAKSSGSTQGLFQISEDRLLSKAYEPDLSQKRVCIDIIQNTGFHPATEDAVNFFANYNSTTKEFILRTNNRIPLKSIQLLNLQGQVLHQQVGLESSDIWRIPVHHMPKGIYLIQWTGERFKKSAKVLKDE